MANTNKTLNKVRRTDTANYWYIFKVKGCQIVENFPKYTGNA